VGAAADRHVVVTQNGVTENSHLETEETRNGQPENEGTVNANGGRGSEVKTDVSLGCMPLSTPDGLVVLNNMSQNWEVDYNHLWQV